VKKLATAVIIFLVLFLIGAAILPHLGKLPWSDNVTVTAIPKVKVKEYLVAVAKFKSYRQNYTSLELQQAKLAIVDQDVTLLPVTFKDLNPKVISITDIKTTLLADYLVLLTPDQVDFSMKSLIIDGINYWDKDADLTNYPLQTEVEMTPELAAEQVTGTKSTYFVSGEIIPARAVDRLALNKNNNYTYLFDFFANDIKSADLSIAMLENPLDGNPTPCTGCMTFIGDGQNAQGFKDVGFDMFSLAGNHAGNGGQAGYKETLRLFDAAQIGHSGTGNSDAAKIAPAIKDIDGYRVGLIGADAVASFYFYKGSSIYGTNFFSSATNSGIDYARVAQLSKIKADNKIDYLIVYMSWGIEYTNKAIKFQTDLAHAFIDNGVDLVVASHPHWSQNIEFYKGKPIFYSLGNFIFDQQHTYPTRQGIVLKLDYLDHVLKSIEIIPLISCGPSVTSINITDQYLQGKVTMNDLETRNEKTGCVYFQPRKVLESEPVYKTIMDRVFQYTNIE